MHTFTLQGIQVRGKSSYQSFTFTGSHLCNTTLVENNTTDKLYAEMLHAQNTLAGLTDNCECLRKKIIQCLSLFQTFLKLSGLSFQFLIT